MTLKEIRRTYHLSQSEASNISHMPLRTYIRYEQDDNYGDEIKRRYIINSIKDKCEITETKGLLSIESIQKELTLLFDQEYKGLIEYCYLFGSYAKGYAKESSDVDLCISTSIKGLEFVGLIEKIRVSLHKNVDVIKVSSLTNNLELLNEIMIDGIRIYEQH